MKKPFFHLFIFTLSALLALSISPLFSADFVSISPDSPQDFLLDSQDLHSPEETPNNEVFINDGAIFELSGNDADISMFEQDYALKPKSKALKNFLNRQNTSSRQFRSLSSGSNTIQFQNQDNEIVFYHSSKKGSNLYSKIAPKRFNLLKSEYVDETHNPRQIQEIYIIENFEDSILSAHCQIVQSKEYIRDRPRSEMLINLNKTINPKLSSNNQIKIFLECDIKPSEDILS